MVKNVQLAGDSVQRSDAPHAGHAPRIEWPTNGKGVWRTLTVRQNDKVIRRTRSSARSSVITGVALIGTGGPSAPAFVP